jgi:ubiquinone/menaquinone biosynthesis C-methylase UbiE
MAISFTNRSADVEIMDDLLCEGEVVDQTLRELDFINHWLGGNAVTLQALALVWNGIPKDKAITIADLGCGSGEMLRIISAIALKQKRKVELIGVDANPNITQFATDHSKGFKNIQFFAHNVFEEPFKSQRFDIVLATLFTHHFSNEELVALLKQIRAKTKHAIIINDIHRHPLAYYSIKWLTQLFSKSAMVKFDAPLSVMRAFTKNEWIFILKEAGIENYSLRWRWAFRWQLIIHP